MLSYLYAFKKMDIMCYFFALFFVFSSQHAFSENIPNGWELKKVSGDGKLYKVGKINVCVLEGNFYEMGLQYGKMMKDEINGLYDLMVKRDVYGKGISHDVSSF